MPNNIWIKFCVAMMILFVLAGIVRLGSRAVNLAVYGENVVGANIDSVSGSGEIRIIRVNQTNFSPNTIQLTAGRPYRLKFVTQDIYSCIRNLVLPQLNIQVNLPATGETIVDLPALSPGRYDFMCSMGMFRGLLLVN